jgi:hypothetical protein
MKRSLTALIALVSLVLSSTLAAAQSSQQPPTNPYAADSPWPQFHRNGHAQASTPLPGPQVGDSLQAQAIAFPRSVGTPTQMHVSERYPDGSRTLWSTTLNSIVKARVRGETFELAHIRRIHEGPGLTAYWNMQLARGNQAFVPDPRTRALLRFGDSDPKNPMSPIRLQARFALPASLPGKPIVLNLSYDGWVIFLTDAGWLGAVKQDFSAWRAFDLGRAIDDTTVHNSFPLDENGIAYFVSFKAMQAVQWTGSGFRVLWRTPYDFRGPGCPPVSASKLREVIRVFRGEGCTGSGTTPTLMAIDDDRLVIAVDGHEKNRLVAFWRDAIPAGWEGLPGQDRRVAAIVALPYATSAGDGFTVENSPPAWNGDIVVAQYAGFNPKCDSPRGVQKLHWDSVANVFRIDWTRADVQFNNVMTISAGSGLVYGVGLGKGCRHIYRGLDLASGATRIELPLGIGRGYLDQGNTHALLDDRSIVFGTTNGMMRIRPR